MSKLILATLVLGFFTLAACGGGDDEPTDSGQTGDQDQPSDGDPGGDDGGGTPDQDSPDAGDPGVAGDGDQQTDASGDEDIAGIPVFAGITFAYSISPTSVTLHWLQASDDTTPPDEIEYRAYAGNTSEEAASAYQDGVDPLASVTGETFTTIEGLDTDRTYFFTMVALDEEGNPSPSRLVVELKTIDSEIAIENTPKEVAELDLTWTAGDLNQFTLSGPDASTIQPGDLLIIPNDYGRHLKRILTVTPDGGNVLIECESASLSDVISSGTLTTAAVLHEFYESQGDKRIRMDPSPGRYETSTYTDPAGHIQARGRNYQTHPAFRSGGDTEFSNEVQMTYSVEFIPTVKASARWDPVVEDKPISVRATANGKFIFTATLDYNANASAEYKVTKELFSRKFTFRYFIGYVPVIQDVELKFFAQLDFKAETPIHLQKQFSATKELTYGFVWSEAQGFDLIKEEGFEKTDEFTMEGEASAEATLRVWPVISTTFYKAAEASLTVEANLKFDAHANLLPPPPEMTKFDIKFWVDLWVNARLSIFGKNLLSWESDKFPMLAIPLHSLPDVELAHSSTYLDNCGYRDIFLKLSNGYNNEVQPENITWEVEPAGDLEVAENGLSARFSASNAGFYTIKVGAYGDGFLGPLGTRRASTSLEVKEAPVDDCDPANSIPTGPDAVFGCGLSNGYGLSGPPVPGKSTYAQWERLEVEFPAWCPEPCYTYYQICAHDEPGICFQPAFYEDKPDGLQGSERIGHDIRDPAGGRYAIMYFLQDGFSGPALYYTAYSVGWGSDQHNYGCEQFDHDEQCAELTAIPVAFVNVVGPRAGDGNDEPEEGQRLPINGGRHFAQHVRANDDDWYHIVPNDEGGFGVPFDEEEPYDPTCLIRVESEDGYSVLVLYGTLENAQNRVFPLQRGNRLLFYGVEGQTFYVLVEGPESPNHDYILQVVADCPEESISPFPRPDGVPALSSGTMDNNGQTIEATLGISPNTERVDIQIRDFEGGNSGANGSVSGLSGTVAVIPITGLYAVPGDYYVDFTLFTAGMSHWARYMYNPAFSTTCYTVERSSIEGLYSEVTDLPLVLLTIVD